MEQTRQAEHSHCIVCGQSSQCGLGLRFAARPGGGVEARFECQAHMQGYDGVLHGGITSSLLDGAMTNCLFARSLVAVTAEIKVQYRHQITLDRPMIVSAHVTRSHAPLHVVEANIVQDECVKAKATGKFMEIQR